MTLVDTIALIIVTLVFIGFFSGIEIAFFSANRLNLELKKKQGSNSGIIIGRFIESPAKFLGTSLIGVNLFLVIYGLLFSQLMTVSLWKPLGVENEYLQLVLDTLLSTFIVLMFGEFIPKAVFRSRADSVLISSAPLMSFFHSIFYPAARVFLGLSRRMLDLFFDIKIKDRDEAYSKVDLEHYFQQSAETADENQELNAELFENALLLPNVKVRECLVPRTEIEAVEKSISIAELRKRFIETKLTRIVVYENNIDNIVGYVHQLDLFKRPDNITNILLTIPVVSESMSAMDLIKRLTRERKSIAWVIDEFGGTSGIVTMEDALEEIFGEIKDEYDTEDLIEKQLSEDEYIFSGRMELDYLKEKYELEFPEDESETLSGYIINAHESIPKLKERIIIGRYEFNVLSVGDTRIETVKLRILR